MTELDLPTYMAATRLGGLAVGPGDALALGAATVGPDGTSFVTELRSGSGDRLVKPAAGTAAVAWTQDGDLVFRAKREDAEAPEEEKVGDAGSLWLLPMSGGEARRLASAPAGIGGAVVARAAGVLVAKVDVFPFAASLEDDRAIGKARKDAGASALLWDTYPIRYWDHPLAPREPRVFVTDLAGAPLRDLTGPVGNSLVEQDFCVTSDGSTVISGWARAVGNGGDRYEVVSFDVATGDMSVVLAEDGWNFGGATLSPDDRWLAYTRENEPNPGLPPSIELWILERATGEKRRLAAELDRWADSIAFTGDSATVIFGGSDLGNASVWAVPVSPAGAPAVRLSHAGSFTEITPSWSGPSVYAMRSRIDAPPELVSLSAAGVDQEPAVLQAESFGLELPGRLEEVATTAADGTPLRAWLVLPSGASAAEPAPLALFIHGGPLGSWNAWSWRWQPYLLAARGYGVLLPDPALSTGYGQAMVNRGWGQWGGAPWDDVLALTDAALSRDDLDETRTAVMGGSYGGYLTNWAITHTDRFLCAVTHASLWDLAGFRGTTDHAKFWEQEFGHPRVDKGFYEEWSPATYADAIVTPTLVIHGEQDFRVPISEGLMLYTELQRSGVPSQLLYFPDENHWILKPGNIPVWYDAVLAWLDHYVLGKELVRPRHV